MRDTTQLRALAVATRDKLAKAADALESANLRASSVRVAARRCGRLARLLDETPSEDWTRQIAAELEQLGNARAALEVTARLLREALS